ncbi:hypothetical protein MF271_10080 [Deinococcus sp. KNUC1210]|uniref:hypothetical protein n=1 Tax=Deinococcus sp. KNUC1210 TaxID=2917691 RepID=UPI001EEFD291|nr:hypothetical protein [Deinococcus sp. KNUC1210]ULH14389.1 hypothetical protein MF271_10080 [Deinococcus sp. KNUC1210]
MYIDAFPACTVEGPIYPAVPFDYIAGSIPQKCSQCSMQFEGSCRRGMSLLGRFLSLDYGPCRLSGSTHPAFFEDTFIASKVEVPKKCTTCKLLRYDGIYGFRCAEDADVWGQSLKALDWGAWEPDALYVELVAPKITTKLLVKAAKDHDLVAFVKEYRRINPNVSIVEAKEDFQFLSTGLTSGA